MRFLDWWLFGCAVVSGGAAGWLGGQARHLLVENARLTDLADEGFGSADEWWLAHRDLDARVTHAHTVATALGQTDIVTILNGETA